MAYIRKGSVKSLGASLGAAFILALCGRNMVGSTAISSVRVAFGATDCHVCSYHLNNSTNYTNSFSFAPAAITLLLGIAMSSRFAESKKIMPAGLVCMFDAHLHLSCINSLPKVVSCHIISSSSNASNVNRFI